MNAITKGYEDVPMTRRRAQLLSEYADKLADMLESAPDDQDLAEWVQSKIDRAAAAIQSAYHYLDQEEDELEKAAGHKYTHRKRVGTDKRGRARYRYYYQEHHGGGITSAKFEAGSSFKLTYKGRRGHFHIQSVKGDMVTITHDGRPGMEPVPIHRDELRALLKKQHGKALEAHVEKRRREVEALDRDRSRKRSGLGLALHRLRQEADKAGISLPEQYQRKPKKTRAPAQEPREDNFETMPESEAPKTPKRRTLEEAMEYVREQQGTPVLNPRNELTETAQQIIEEANQDHDDRHDEHQEITKFELGEHTHTKTGQKLYTAKQKERTDRDEYFRRVEIAKRYKGRYERRYVKGFVFKTAEDARAFALEIEGVPQTPEASAETVRPHEDHPSADNFETMPEVTAQPTRTAHTIVLDRLIEAKRSGNEAQEAQINEQLRPQLLNLLEKLEQGTLDDGERQALLSRYQELETLTTGAGKELAQEIVSRLRGADNFETMPEVESAGTPKTLLDDIRSEITVERFIREGRRREDTAEREVKKILSDLEKLEQGLLNREYSTEAKQAKAQEILNRRLPKILEQVRRLVSAKLVRPQLSGGTGQRNAARYHRALGDIGIAEDRANEEYRRTLKELDRLEEKPPQPTTPREQLTETAREVTQSKVREAVNQSRAFINDLIFNKQGKLTRARNRNKLKGYSDNGARSVAADIVSETMREVSPHLMNHTNRQNYENQAHVNVARVLSESKGLTREEIAVSIETVLRDTAQKTNVLNPPKEMVLPNQTGEISEFGERLTDRETVEINVSSPETDTQPAPDPSPARAQLAETVREISEPKSPLNIDQANAQDTLTENRTRAPESKAADKALIESARELAKTSERGEEIKSALVDLMNAQQLKRYKRATGDMSARAEDMIEKRREARERLRAATSGEVINNFETMPETEAQPKKRTGPDISRYKRALSLAKKGKRLDKLTNGRRSKASREADQALIKLAQEILEKDLGDVEVRTIYRKPTTMWTREESLKVAIGAMAGELKTRQRSLGGKGGADQAQELRADARERLIDVIQEHVDRFLPDEVIDARLERDLARDARETAKQEAREAQEARQYQQKTFTPEIQGAIDTLKFGIGLGPNRRKSYTIENFFKTRKDGGVYKTTKTPAQLAESIAENLPESISSENYNTHDFAEDTLRALITRAINQGVEARETPAELKDRIGSVITQRAQDNAASQKTRITGEGQRKALLEMRRNINTLSGTGYFDEYRRRGERSYMGLGAIEKTLGMSERLDNLYVDAIFREALPPELERFKTPITRFSTKGADEVAGAFANKYETVGEIRDNISTIREQMRATIKTALDQTTNALVKRPTTLDLINQSYEKATERLNTDRQKNIENARALAQYTDNPQAHLAEIQELERQSDQTIAEQMEINSEFARAYIHEASDLVERALETTKGEVIDNVMSVKTPKHADKFTATVRGKANRKLMARIFNEVFEQVRREIGDEPIERGENHPRNIADTVQKPSKTPAQFRDDIERAREEKRAQARAKREEVKARSATTVQKSLSAPKLTKTITYRAQLLQTVERLTA